MESKEDLKWRDVQTNRNDDGSKTHISIFFTPKFKYNVEVSEYKNHFYLVSFYPKIHKDWYDKQLKRKMYSQDYLDKYSYKTNENNAFKVFRVLVEHISDILKKDPLASFGYFGAPDVKSDNDEDIFETQRYRVYNTKLGEMFNSTHRLVGSPEYSGGLLVNRIVEENFPGIVNYGIDILQTHL